MLKQFMDFTSTEKTVTRFVGATTAVLLTLSSMHAAAAPGRLSQTPLFIAKAVQPNIFFLLDDSGSMDAEVLLRSDPNNQGGSGSLDFTPNDNAEELEHCFGYNVLAYDPTDTYVPWAGLDRNGNPFTDSNPNSAMVNPYTGNANAGACDDWGMVYNTNGTTCNLISGFPGGNGGFYQPWNDADNDNEYDTGECSTNANTRIYISTLSAAQQTNYANWFSYYRKREYVMKRAVSQIIADSTERMGMATINRNNHITKNTEVGTQVKDLDDQTLPVNATAAADKATLLDNLLGINSGGGTPLRRGLEHVGEYFMGAMNDGSLFGYTPTNQTDSASGHSPILSSTLGGTCQQNFALVMSDGYWNKSDPAVGNADQDGAGSFDGQSYADTFSNTLADVAMHFYETDLLSSLANEVPAVAIDQGATDAATCTGVSSTNAAIFPQCFDNNSQQHLVTFTVAFGLSGTIPETDGLGNPCIPGSRGLTLAAQGWPSSCDANLANGWPQPVGNSATTVDDMKHAAWNGRGQFLSAASPRALINQLQAAINEISSRKTVAAAAVAVSSTDITAGASYFQAKLDSETWSSEFFKYDITATLTGPTPEWEAHTLLDARAFTDRQIVTYNGTSGIPFDFPSDYTNLGTGDISQSQVNDLLYNAPNDISLSLNAAQIAENQSYGEDLVDYLFGDTTNEGTSGTDFRNRNGHKLGDIVNSSPVFVGDPDPDYDASASYQTWANSTAKGREEMIYVGANDGALHAFNADTGAEVFAYYPQAIFSEVETGGLHWLAKQNYEHRFYVDGEIVTAEVTNLDGAGANTWSTVLVGTLNAGGKAIYALDISDPSSFTSETSVAQKILWEFSHDDLGYTYSTPTIARLNNNRWAAIFGNGYNAGGPNANGQAALFIKYLDNVAPSFDVIYTGVGSIDTASRDCLNANSDCNGLSTPAVVDLGADNVADRVYAGDLKGNLWVFDLSASTSGSWTVENSAPLFTATTSANSPQPITSQPYVVLHPTERHGSTAPNAMVFFGTGQYMAENDASSTGENTFYAIWDQGVTNQITGNRDTVLVEQTSTPDTVSGRDVRLLSNNTVDYTTARGWYYDLPDTGERVVYSPIVVGELVVYTTIVPESNLCSGSGGHGWLMVHNLADGSEPDFIALDVNGDTFFDASDQSGDENVGGVKVGTLSKPTFVKKDKVVGDILLPDDSINPSLSRTGLQYGLNFGSRSSWGRYKKD
jgi:type IV pilus assembly protein PilY1